MMNNKPKLTDKELILATALNEIQDLVYECSGWGSDINLLKIENTVIEVLVETDIDFQGFKNE